MSATTETDPQFIREAKCWLESLAVLSDGEVCCKLADLLAERSKLERERDEAREVGEELAALWREFSSYGVGLAGRVEEAVAKMERLLSEARSREGGE